MFRSANASISSPERVPGSGELLLFPIFQYLLGEVFPCTLRTTALKRGDRASAIKSSLLGAFSLFEGFTHCCKKAEIG
jgi:hypothetical protein